MASTHAFKNMKDTVTHGPLSPLLPLLLPPQWGLLRAFRGPNHDPSSVIPAQLQNSSTPITQQGLFTAVYLCEITLSILYLLQFMFTLVQTKCKFNTLSLTLFS